ncbi:MAG: sugar phosphate isomerase/epimerase family protein [Armatimonadota bacterium]|jgi:sugar phosphate isomerase/epimerase
MQLGMMNDPRKPPREEFAWAAQHGFEFVDFTLEPPSASASAMQPELQSIRDTADQHGLGLIGHTAYYLPLASPLEGLREAAVAEFTAAFDTFEALGVKRVNIHPQAMRPTVFSKEQVLAAHVEVLGRLAAAAVARGLRPMVENGPYGTLSTVGDFEALFAAVDGLGLHLDVGHANLIAPENQTDCFLEAFADRLLHVHFSDNMGPHVRDDLHLPLGTGSVAWPEVIEQLKAHGYDDTITLEVFSPDRRFLLLSRDKVLEWWG